MRDTRFPPLFSGAGVAAAALATLVLAVALFGIGGYAPFWLLATGNEGPVPALAMWGMAAALSVLIYRLAAPRIWRFTRLYAASPSQQPSIPGDLLARCLRDTDYPCPACAYNLRGLEQPSCPECSTPVTLYLYAERPANARWNGLIFAWLVLMLVGSAMATYIYGQTFLRVTFSGWGGAFGYYGMGVTYAVVTGVSAVTSAGSLVSCAVLGLRAVIPKPPHKQARFARTASVWLAALSASWVLAFSLQCGVLLLQQLWY